MLIHSVYVFFSFISFHSRAVVESNVGLDRTYASLPVLVLRDYSALTPALLAKAYPCFVQHASAFAYAHLRESYWLGLVRGAVQSGDVAGLMEAHPFRHKFCNFLDS